MAGVMIGIIMGVLGLYSIIKGKLPYLWEIDETAHPGTGKA